MTTTSEETSSEDIVTPWDVQANSSGGIDYDKLINRFGSSKISEPLLLKFQNSIGSENPLSHLLLRGIFFSHRDMEVMLEENSKGNKFFLYTGRGPSSDAMHVGHLIPFLFTKWLQDVFNTQLVIQLTADEKFIWKSISLKEIYDMTNANAKDIIAIGFDPQNTLLFNDLDFLSVCSAFYCAIVKIQRCIKVCQIEWLLPKKNDEVSFVAEACAETGDESKPSDCIGSIAYAGMKCAGLIYSSLGSLLDWSQNESFLRSKRRPLIVCEFGQSDFLLYSRIFSTIVSDSSLKPLILGHAAVPGLLSVDSRMCDMVINSTIFISDSNNQIKNKVNKYAFSGGGVTTEEHQARGGNCQVDVTIKLLQFLLQDSEKWKNLCQEYSSGKLLTGVLKKLLIDLLCQIFEGFRVRRQNLKEQDVMMFLHFKKSFEQNFDVDSLLEGFDTPVDVSPERASKICFSNLARCFALKNKIDLHPILSNYKNLLPGRRDLDGLFEYFKENNGGTQHTQNPPLYIFYSHRPVGECLNLGQIIPLLFIKWLQERLCSIPVLIHVTSDEIYFQQQISNKEVEVPIDTLKAQAYQHKLDIISLGFSSENTCIFSSFDIMTPFYENVCRIQHRVTLNQVKSIFGFTDDDCIGKIGFPAIQAAPSFSSSFLDYLPLCSQTVTHANTKSKSKQKKGEQVSKSAFAERPCLIPCAIDQDPYFRMTRDVAVKLNFRKPALLHSTFFPALQGAKSKMSASSADSAVFITDSAQQIHKKLTEVAFCFPEDKQNDVPYQYFRHFLTDKSEFEKIDKMYDDKTLSSSRAKIELAELMTKFLEEIQAHREKVDDEMLSKFYSKRLLN